MGQAASSPDQATGQATAQETTEQATAEETTEQSSTAQETTTNQAATTAEVKDKHLSVQEIWHDVTRLKTRQQQELLEEIHEQDKELRLRQPIFERTNACEFTRIGGYRRFLRVKEQFLKNQLKERPVDQQPLHSICLVLVSLCDLVNEHLLHLKPGDKCWTWQVGDDQWKEIMLPREIQEDDFWTAHEPDDVDIRRAKLPHLSNVLEGDRFYARHPNKNVMAKATIVKVTPSPSWFSTNQGHVLVQFDCDQPSLTVDLEWNSSSFHCIIPGETFDLQDGLEYVPSNRFQLHDDVFDSTNDFWPYQLYPLTPEQTVTLARWFVKIRY